MAWVSLGPRFLPFADIATPDLPLSRLLRLSLFQVSVGMALVLLVGTLNRVMIVELGVPASLVGIMLALPLVFAPFRALIGYRSDTHRCELGWRRVPSQGTYTNLFKKMELEAVNGLLRKVEVELGWSSVQVAVDGKTIKGSLHRDKRLHTVNVATPEGIPISQAESERAGGEIKSALKQIERLDLSGKVVSGDALFAQEAFCRAIKKKGDNGF